MESNKKLASILATAAAVAFVSAPFTSTLAQANHHEVKCYGVNACKGQSHCKTAKNACKGKNSCKGQGFAMESTKKCKEMGGSMHEPKEST
jgi:uncharacterized membrane protein